MYAEWISDDGLLRVEGLARDGLTDAQIAGKIGITTTTLYEWQNRFPAFSDALKRGKAPVDQEVENALLKRAKGYTTTETVEEIYTTGQKDENGQYTIRERHIRKITKEVPPDTTAQIFWLKNRRPDKWRDKQDISGTFEPIQIVWGKE